MIIGISGKIGSGKNIVSTIIQGLKAKFLQNENLLHELNKTENKILVEASPFDRIWGIGYESHNALNNISNWGQNKLGKLLTELKKRNMQKLNQTFIVSFTIK